MERGPPTFGSGKVLNNPMEAALSELLPRPGAGYTW